MRIVIDAVGRVDEALLELTEFRSEVGNHALQSLFDAPLDGRGHVIQHELDVLAEGLKPRLKGVAIGRACPLSKLVDLPS